MEYRDIHGGGDNVGTYLKVIENSDMSVKQKEKIQEFVKLLRIGKIGSKVKDRKIALYLQFLVKLHKYFQKDLDKITEKEAEKFYGDLEKNIIKKNNGMPYAEESKNAFIVALKRYIGFMWNCWEDKQDPKYRKVFGWMKEAISKSSKKAITLEQATAVVEKWDDKKADPADYSLPETQEMYKTRNISLFMFLFCSGARIEEGLNVRFSDLTKSDKSKEGYFIVHLRGTKTEESDRTIALPIATKYLNAWIKEHPTKEDNDFLFPINYDNARKIIKMMSKKALGFELKPHELRHSSATHYIQHGGFGAENIGGFYYRYGWRFGSKEALTYIKTYLYGGEMGQDKMVKHIVNDRVEKLEQEVEILRKIQKKMAEKWDSVTDSLEKSKIQKKALIEMKGKEIY